MGKNINFALAAVILCSKGAKRDKMLEEGSAQVLHKLKKAKINLF